jgi:hypothetical protein
MFYTIDFGPPPGGRQQFTQLYQVLDADKWCSRMGNHRCACGSIKHPSRNIHTHGFSTRDTLYPKAPLWAAFN